LAIPAMPFFEHHSEPLLPSRAFVFRMLRFGSFAVALVVFSLLLGMTGYMGFAHLGVVDAFVNAAMIMGGMGPVSELGNSASKIFAGVYAIYCGMLLLVAVGITLAPALHRTLHTLHLERGK
jgi:hypothetical protein